MAAGSELDAVAVGNAIVDRTFAVSNLPAPDGGAFAEEVEERPGGVAANVAATLRALGRDVGVIARLGDDGVADRVLADLDDRGIDRRRVRIAPGERSSYCVVLRDPDGRRMIVGAGESTSELRLDATDLEYLDRAEVAFTSGYVPPAVLESLVDWRREGRGSTLAFDLAGRFADLERRGLSRDALDSMLPAIDCFIANRHAVGSYVGAGDVDRQIEALRRRGATRGVVTLGANGAVLFDAAGVTEVEAVQVDVVDTTGAGDSFSAGLIEAWVIEGQPARAAGRFAAAAAAYNCTAVGARGAVPTRGDVARLLAEGGKG